MIKLDMGSEDELSMLRFTLEMTRALAWPATILAVTWIFRASLRKLSDKVGSFEGWGMKLDFGRKAVDLQEQVEELALEETGTAAEVDDALEAIAEETVDARAQPNEIDSQAAEALKAWRAPSYVPNVFEIGRLGRAKSLVFIAWKHVEEALKQAAVARGLVTPDIAPHLSVNVLVRTLEANGVITAKTARLVRAADEMGKYAEQAGTGDLATDSAQSYADSAYMLASIINTDANNSDSA